MCMKIHISPLSALVTVVGLSLSVTNPSLAHAFPSQLNSLKTFMAPTAQSLGCASFKDDFWDMVDQFPINGSSFATTADVHQSLADLMMSPRFAKLTGPERDQVAEKLTNLYQFVIQSTAQTQNTDQALELLSALELGDRTSPEKEAFQNAIGARFQEIENLLPLGTLECAQPVKAEALAPTFSDNSMLGTWQRSRSPVVFGALKAIATAYQSCDAGNLAPVNHATPDIKGITITGHHSDGIGNVRKISDLKGLLETDYYFTHYNKPSSNCFDVRSSPMIYNYGGKPYTTSSAGATMNFFRRAGSGGQTLGIDCSGYVYSSLAAAGLKVKKDGRLKTTGVYGISARMYMNPKGNGLTCLNNVTFNSDDSLHAGDILASGGHVTIIESVGHDPFGVAGFTKESECAKANMSGARMNFNILQSSPVKNGMGINKITVAEFLVTETNLADGLLQHAADACLAHVRHSSVLTHSKTTAIVRHLGTKECQDQTVPLAHESCIDSCPATVAL
jgi:hypothetical protein